MPAAIAERLEVELRLADELATLADRLEHAPRVTPRGVPAGELEVERVALLRASATGRVYWHRLENGDHRVEVRGSRSGYEKYAIRIPPLPAGASRMHDDGELVVEGEPLVIAWRSAGAGR